MHGVADALELAERHALAGSCKATAGLLGVLLRGEGDVVGILAVVGRGRLVRLSLHLGLGRRDCIDDHGTQLLLEKAVELVLAPGFLVIAVRCQDAIPGVLPVAPLVILLFLPDDIVEVGIAYLDSELGAFLAYELLGNEDGVEHVAAKGLRGVAIRLEELRPGGIGLVLRVLACESLR